MATRIIRSWLVISMCAVSTAALAQDDGARGPVERALAWTETKVDGAAGARDGFYPEFGSVIVGGGIAAGPGFRTHLAGNRMMIDVSGALSMRGYANAQSTIAWPQLAGGRMAAGAQLRYNDFTQINYFGIGRDAARDAQTDYRLKYVDASAFATWRAGRSISISGRAGMMRRADMESGTSTIVPSIEQRFDASTAPGLFAAPNYVHADASIDADTRDVPGYPTAGGRYRLSVAAYRDREFGRYSFESVEAEGIQYLPIGERSVASVRGRVDVTAASAGQVVPFYLMPSLGSGQSLRGYDDYRFRDRNAALVNAEWRSHVAGPVDAAIFYDAGSVASSVAALTANRLITDYGVGVRLHSRRHLLMRVDVARGTEGLHAIVSFTPSLSLSKRTLAPFVP